MTRATAIVDTNVVVAGLLTRNATSPVVRVLDGVLGAAFPFVISEAPLAEHRGVLVRPELRRLHGLTDEDIDVFLTDLVQNAIVLAPAAAALPAPDPGNQLLWDLPAARDDLLLVTGDKLSLQAAAMQGQVISAQALVTGR